MFSSNKNDQQNNTETEAYKARMNFGAEKEKQILNEIRNSKKQTNSVFESQFAGGYFNLALTFITSP
ncbi:unnamed protein product [Ambrosiozyma monospora]|uniref:Unnamed protein product n=1 Tax=Ambrosiozyma monospora TaxID=43982 RepID=A0A9W6Z0I6_AMBMO|nr:unnamed protein product [Ambrosiozyma monospora]